MTVVDSSVWVDYFRDLDTPQTLWIDAPSREASLGVNGLILCEVLQGARSLRALEDMQRAMLSFSYLKSDGVALAVAAAENYRLLRSLGITIRKTADTLIATMCIREGYELLHNDRDFDPFEEHLRLRVVHP